MFFTINRTNGDLNIIDQTDFKSLNIYERSDIEKWVIEKPEILGEDLYIITNEYDKFDKTSERLDILALDKQGNLVVVELKRDDSGKTVELQAIKYAAYCATLTLEDVIEIHKDYLFKKDEILSEDEVKQRLEEFVEDELDSISDKPRIIITSGDFRPEVTATVLWLRKFGIDISCVKFSAYSLSNNDIAVTTSVIIPLTEAEEYIIRAERKESNETGTIEKNEKRYKFLTGLKNRVSQEMNIEDNLLKLNHKYKYLQIKTECPNTHFEFCFRRRGALEVGLHFEKNNDKKNKEKVEQIKNKFDSILKSELNENLTFQTEWNSRKWARIFVISDPVEPKLENWAIEKMKVLYKVLINEIG